MQAIDRNFTVEKLLQNLQLMDASGQLTLSGLLLLSKSIQRYRPVFTIKCVSFVGNTEASTQFRDKMRNRDAEGNSPGILPDGVTEESIKHGISVPRNKLLFENAKDILPYTGIGSGIMRAMQSYDKISFKNDFVREEFITTLIREDIPDEMIIYQSNEAINDSDNFGVNENTPKNDTVNFGVNEDTPKNDMVNFGVNETQKQILKLISENPQITAGEMAYRMKQTKRNIEYNIKVLKSKAVIERFGSDKTGGYQIKP